VLADKLRSAGVQVIYVEYPQTEHAFDLLPPGVSPAAQASWYETERFLALLAIKPVATSVTPGANGTAVGQEVRSRT
jgi:acetyl esterase/lipase